jgi:hypothetical protein
MVLSLDIAPPINPLAWVKSISFMPDIAISFYWSFIPLHYYFKPLRSSNEPYLLGTA